MMDQLTAKTSLDLELSCIIRTKIVTCCQGTCFAGQQIEAGTISSWWMIDIGQDHQV